MRARFNRHADGSRPEKRQFQANIGHLVTSSPQVCHPRTHLRAEPFKNTRRRDFACTRAALDRVQCANNRTRRNLGILLPSGNPFMFYDTRKNDHGLPHNPFKAIVAPRPIGWITSMSAKGEINLAPYSFFNAVTDRPPIVMFSSEGPKDSAALRRGEQGIRLQPRHLRPPGSDERDVGAAAAWRRRNESGGPRTCAVTPGQATAGGRLALARSNANG